MYIYVYVNLCCLSFLRLLECETQVTSSELLALSVSSSSPGGHPEGKSVLLPHIMEVFWSSLILLLHIQNDQESWKHISENECHKICHSLPLFAKLFLCYEHETFVAEKLQSLTDIPRSDRCSMGFRCCFCWGIWCSAGNVCRPDTFYLLFSIYFLYTFSPFASLFGVKSESTLTFAAD